MNDLEMKLDLSCKLASGLYNFSKINKDTEISRYWLTDIRDNGQDTKAPKPILVALDSYFKNLNQ